MTAMNRLRQQFKSSKNNDNASISASYTPFEEEKRKFRKEEEPLDVPVVLDLRISSDLSYGRRNSSLGIFKESRQEKCTDPHKLRGRFSPNTSLPPLHHGASSKYQTRVELSDSPRHTSHYENRDDLSGTTYPRPKQIEMFDISFQENSTRDDVSISQSEDKKKTKLRQFTPTQCKGLLQKHVNNIIPVQSKTSTGVNRWQMCHAALALSECSSTRGAPKQQRQPKQILNNEENDVNGAMSSFSNFSYSSDSEDSYTGFYTFFSELLVEGIKNPIQAVGGLAQQTIGHIKAENTPSQ